MEKLDNGLFALRHEFILINLNGGYSAAALVAEEALLASSTISTE